MTDSHSQSAGRGGMDRYSRQILFRPIGDRGQVRLMQSRVLLCGCGALGSAIADGIVRAGVGFVRLIDRDFVELSNLQRQSLFDESDVADQLPKAVAAGRKLAKINSQVQVEPIVADINHSNIRDFASDVDLILDGMDNFETRFLINDLSLETGIPWIYGGCIGSHGQTMTVIPGRTACLRCLMDSVPPPGTTETCDTAGIIGPIINVIAALQVASALRFLSRDLPTSPEAPNTTAGVTPVVAPDYDVDESLSIIDVWEGSFRKLSVKGLRERSECGACVKGERDWLSGSKTSHTTVLCGRNSVQVCPSTRMQLSIMELSLKLSSSGTVKSNPYLLKLTTTSGGYEITVFPDGRAIIKGTSDPSVAKSLYARFIGA